MVNTEYLIGRFQCIGFSLTDLQLNQFVKYYELLLEWNAKFNLTAITEYNQVVLKHFIDSVSLFYVDKNLINTKSIIDIGTGAGFPGIPIKIVMPNIKVTLLDSLNKRVKFLDEVIYQLELKEMESIHGRAEDIGRDKNHREVYDLCVSRAVANLATLSEYALPFVKINGDFIAYKSGEYKNELKNSKEAIQFLGGKLCDVVEFKLSDTDIKRSFIKIKKIKNTSNTFPRKAGKPIKEPLGNIFPRK